MAQEPYDPDTGEIMPDDPLSIRTGMDDAAFEEAMRASLEEGADYSDPIPEEDDEAEGEAEGNESPLDPDDDEHNPDDGVESVAPEQALFDEAVEGAVRGDRPPMKDDEDWRKHNQTAYSVTADELRQFIERYEQLQAEKKDISEQMTEVMAEAKGRGYDTKVMRKVIQLRKRNPSEIAEEEAVLEMYKQALGMA